MLMLALSKWDNMEIYIRAQENITVINVYTVLAGMQTMVSFY
jgi:hypothetical protein